MSSPRPRPRRDAAFAAALAAGLTTYNNLAGRLRWPGAWYPAANLGATAIALTAAAGSGLTATELGLRRGQVAAGVRTGGPVALALGAGWVILAAVPATRPVLGDRRVTGLSRREVAYQAMVRIPVGTVLWEETAFRGVLQAALIRVLPRAAALATTSAVFGLWHIRPTLDALRVNQVAGSRRATLGCTAAAVAATAAAGLLLSGLRERSGSLAAPVLLHLTANSGAVLAARAAAEWNNRPADVVARSIK
jgi:membrane protease YdiL (CAAX protease family)